MFEIVMVQNFENIFRKNDYYLVNSGIYKCKVYIWLYTFSKKCPKSAAQGVKIALTFVLS